MIEIKNLSVSYGKSDILKNINLTFEKGKVTCIIGPNGSGKTTLLHSLSRLISSNNGEIVIDGRNISDFGRKELARKVALLPQFREVPDMPVFSFVLSGRYPYTQCARYSDEDRKQALDAMCLTGISHLADRNIRTLSGGERQRVYIALCLSQGTDIILFDEPTTYLDIRHQFDILQLINNLNGKTVVAVVHDITQALKYSDRIVLMNEGKIRACGTPHEIASSGFIEEVFGICLDKSTFTVSPI